MIKKVGPSSDGKVMRGVGAKYIVERIESNQGFEARLPYKHLTVYLRHKAESRIALL